MVDKEKMAHLEKLVQAAYSALSEAENYAREHGLSFHFSTCYGAGAYFDPTDDYSDEGEDGWFASSRSC